MRRLLPAVAFFTASTLLASVAFAAKYTATVEGGNTVIITGVSSKPERCPTKVLFDYTDPKKPEERQIGRQECRPTQITPGKPTVMCQFDYPVTNIVLKGPVSVGECLPTDKP